MADVLQIRRGTTAARMAYTPQQGELLGDTDTNSLYMGDGSTAGGVPIGGNTSTLTTVTKTAGYTLLTTDSGKYFDNTGAAGSVTLSAPAAAAGLYYGMAVDAAHTFEFLCNGTDRVANGSVLSAAGGNIQSNLPNSFLLLYCYKSGLWVVSSVVGSWTVT